VHIVTRVSFYYVSLGTWDKICRTSHALKMGQSMSNQNVWCLVAGCIANMTTDVLAYNLNGTAYNWSCPFGSYITRFSWRSTSEPFVIGVIAQCNDDQNTEFTVGQIGVAPDAATPTCAGGFKAFRGRPLLESVSNQDLHMGLHDTGACIRFRAAQCWERSDRKEDSWHGLPSSSLFVAHTLAALMLAATR
jgi:hypothetical protein